MGGTGRGCRIPFDGRPAVYARFGRELMRQESDEFSGRDWPNLSGRRACRQLIFGLPLLARGMGMFHGWIHSCLRASLRVFIYIHAGI